MFTRKLIILLSVLSLIPASVYAEALGPDKAIFKSKRLTFESKKKTVEVDVNIKGVKQLYLVVSNGGDGMAFDHANWVNPVLVGPSGEKKLTDLKWKSATQEYGQTAINKTVDGKPLTMEGKKYENGIGTHATSIIVYDIPEGYEKFKALAGIDDETLGPNRRATLQFFVFPGEPDVDLLNGNVSDKFVPTNLFQVPEGLEVTIWATSPMLNNPTNLDVDGQGRIWVAEGMNYRGSRLSKEGDRIIVLEDKNGDGKADSSHTFVQDPELVSPLGVAVVGNKVIVSQPPDLLVYTDVNNDAKFDPSVDKKEVLLTGFQGKNHDHSLHSVTVGPNGQYYFNTGNAGNFKTTDKEGTMVTAASGYNGGAGMAGKPSSDGHIYIGGAAMRINPDGTGLRVIGHNFRNSYEQTVTSFGDVFQNDNDDPPACRTTWLMEYGNLGFFSLDGQRHWGSERRPGQSTEISEWRQEDPGTIPAGDVYGGGSPTGIVYYENGALGEKHKGLLLTCEPSRNVIFGYYPKPEGSGFKLERFDFMTSNPEKKFDGADFTGGTRDGKNVMTYFRPSDVAVGADGAIYVADWFDARVGGHATKDRKGSGTIYRVAPKGFKPTKVKTDLSSIEGQIAALQSPAVNVRGAAFYKLVESGEKAVPALKKLLSNGNDYIKARAVWILAAIGKSGKSEVESLLKNDNPQFRILAYRALRHFHESDLLKNAKKLAADSSSAVRREVALSLRNLPIKETAPLFMELVNRYDGKDAWYSAAIRIGAAGQEQALYEFLKSSLRTPAIDWKPSMAEIAFRLHPVSSIKDLTSRAMAKTLSPEDRKKAVVALGFIETEEAVNAMVTIARYGPEDSKKEANWWVQHRNKNLWRKFDPVKKLTGKSDKQELVDMIVPEKFAEPKTLPSLKEIAELKGDAQKGKAVTAKCIMCHTIRGTGVDFGPDLSIFGKSNSTDVLVQAIVNPSADIAHGYKGTEIKTTNGKTIQGFVIADGDPLVVKAFGGTQVVIDKDKVASRTEMKQSLMIPAAKLGMTAQEIADVIAYLKSDLK